MEMKSVGKITWGQDGAVFNNLLFRFDHMGNCTVYDLSAHPENTQTEHTPLARFTLDKADVIKPHSNSVSFGKEYYNKGDDFPLLYTNIYNNYSSYESKMIGVTCVYRIQRNGTKFSSTLVQIIEIGFTENGLWKSQTIGDSRPYGNFVIDCEKAVYYAFTMRDEDSTTRYFAFDLPKLCDGNHDEVFGVNRVVLGIDDLKFWFDCEYHRYLQGATFNGGLIYSTEGFTDDVNNPPALRIIDPINKAQKEMHLFADHGTTVEPEFIAFENGVCHYCDNLGNLYTLEF
ncbi:MAG: hypothetical protein IIW94_03525 [Clostridia bacterium]|nr:hypothetical protein [Clostridia bacterium]